MEVTIKLTDPIVAMLEEWRVQQIREYREEIHSSARDEPLRRALIGNYKAVKNAEYDSLTEMYLKYQEVERRYQE